MIFDPPAKRPYVIVAAPYDRDAEGVRILHELCHALNLAGAPAGIALMGGKVGPQAFHPGLVTPLPAWIDDSAIVIYPPALTHANPLKAKTVVEGPATEAAFRVILQALPQFISDTQGF